MMVNFPAFNAAIYRAEQRIGRGNEVEISLPQQHTSVSRLHAKVWGDDQERLWIADLASRFGTAVNGVRLKAEQPIEIMFGDRLCLGSVELEVLASSVVLAGSSDNQTALGEQVSNTFSFRRLDEQSGMLSELSPSELEIVVWMCRGYTSLMTIGRKLHRSPNTVKTQLASIFRKTGLHSRDQLVGQLRRAAAGQGFEGEQDVQ